MIECCPSLGGGLLGMGRRNEREHQYECRRDRFHRSLFLWSVALPKVKLAGHANRSTRLRQNRKTPES
jgi:hypothetical protein